ncbi:hypothetical protein DES53_11517 [Roseimicrobium gellanilyticum]|uniref:Uncharacterized protein n=1 Tax=Roseimicrobium gellanilyticum TaxID=748857 RepID=A0A366H6I9_9BACT|nr:hypothetical protein [Roseimicrobium gellanilyticum]RBP36876.1 hypothetical protein DES53_11517 [Roseimicrobium gellanilyticum]
MKTYRVTLTIGVQSFIKADRWLKAGNTIEFLKNGTEVAKYYAASVEKIEDCTSGLPRQPEYLSPGIPPDMR